MNNKQSGPMRAEFRYLDHLRLSGEVNMMGAGPYLQAEFGLDRHEARKVVVEWMHWTQANSEVAV